MGEIKGVISLADVPTFEEEVESLKRVEKYYAKTIPEGTQLYKDFESVIDKAYRKLKDEAEILYNTKIRLLDFVQDVNSRKWA